MRICFVFDAVYPFTKGGVEKRISDLSACLAENGHDVHVIGTRYWRASNQIVEGSTTYHGLNTSQHLYNKRGKRSASQAFWFAVLLIPKLLTQRFDVVETQSTLPLTTLVAWIVSKLRGHTLAIYWHEVWGSHWITYAPVVGWVARSLEALCARLDVIHMAPSVTTAKKVTELGGRQVEIIPLAIDAKLAARISPSPIESDVIYVGRLIEQKNLDLLLDALKLLGRDGVTPNVNIVGDGPDRLRLMSRAAAMGLDSVDFLGRIETDSAVLALMKSSKLFVHPSTREGFGLVVLEAAACGLPVIAVDSPDNAVRELLDKSQLVEPGSASALANKIHELLSNESERHDLSERSRTLALDFTKKRLARGQEDAYRQSGTGAGVLVP